jgi:DNA-binding HxlR family transcriptional regulator
MKHRSTLNTDDMQHIYSLGFKLAGDFWTLNIIYHLHCSNDGLRFNELLELNEGISPSVLTSRLKRMQQYDFLTRNVSTEGRPMVQYKLTPKGEAMMPILKAMYDFAAHYA